MDLGVMNNGALVAALQFDGWELGRPGGALSRASVGGARDGPRVRSAGRYGYMSRGQLGGSFSEGRWVGLGITELGVRRPSVPPAAFEAAEPSDRNRPG